MVKNEKLRILRKYLVKKEEEQKDGPYSYLVPSRYLNFKKYLKLWSEEQNFTISKPSITDTIIINKTKIEKTRREVLLILWITGLQKDPHKPEWINNCQDFVHTNLPEKHKSFDSWIHDLKKATKEKRKKN